MDNYVFDMPENIRQIVEAMRRAGTQGNQPQQEPPTPAQYVDEKVRNGVDANIAADAQQKRLAAEQAQAQAQAQAQQLPPQAQPQAQPQPEQPLLDPLSHDVYRRLVDAKSLYGGADAAVRASAPEGTSEEALQAAIAAIQGTAHQSAEDTRRLAERLGVDMTGYGSDVSLEDAQRNLQTRETREIADILSGRGKYGRSADQYFDDVYMRMIGEGASPSQAKRWAGRQAQQYQAERVTYLRNAFNMFGRDGNYVNDQGVPILQEIAQEMPQVANIYAQAYKLPTAAQDRLEKVYDTERGYQHAFDVADQTFLHNIGLQGNQGKVNAALAQLEAQLTDILNANQSERNVREYGAKASIDHEFWKDKEDYKFLMDDQKWFRENERIIMLGVAAGIKPEEMGAFVAAVRGIKFEELTAGGKYSKETIESAQKAYRIFSDKAKALREELEIEKDPNKRKELEQKIAANQNLMAEIENKLGDALGLPTRQSIPAYTGDQQQDLATIAQIVQYAKANGLTDTEAFTAVRDWVHQADPQITDHFIEGLIQKATGSR